MHAVLAMRPAGVLSQGAAIPRDHGPLLCGRRSHPPSENGACLGPATSLCGGRPATPFMDSMKLAVHSAL